MPNIALPERLPGISAGFAFRPETAKPMREWKIAAWVAHFAGNFSHFPPATKTEECVDRCTGNGRK